MSGSPHVIDVSEADFEANVIDRSRQVPVVVDFWADWCAPCRALGPILEKLAERDQGSWVLAKVDTQANQGLAERFQIQGIPNVKAFVNGEVAEEFSGALPEHAVDQWLQKIVPSQADEALELARALEADGRLAEAVEQYIEVLAADPEHAGARGALIEALVRSEDVAEARTLVEAIAPHQWGNSSGQLERAWLAVNAAEARPETDLRSRVADGDLAARFELAMLLAARGEWGEAFEELLTILSTDRTFRDDIGRVAMVRLFEVAGDDSEVTNRYRGRMGAVMYV